MHGFEADAPDPDPESAIAGLSFAGLTEFQGRSAAALGADLAPGSRLGDVTIVRFVAAGGMGKVYEALQGMPCRTVAVKVIHPGVLSAHAAKRFEYEAQILGRLTHPGIARIYSVGLQQLSGCQVPYFVMEYIEEARSITAYATQHDLPTRDRVELFREVCSAVAHGHHKGVIHRDLKPGNILVDALGQPKIIDFGVARSTDADVALTTMHTDIGQLVGTLQYMCPEQFDGLVDELDVRADVYSLGVVLYELLACRAPYDIGKRPVYEAARIVKEVDPKPLSSVSSKLRGDLSTIVATCLEKDRSRRYSSAAELEADLGRYLRGEPIVASAPRLLDSLVRLARRHRLAAAAAAGVVAALTLAMVGISIFAVRAERQRLVAVDAQSRADEAAKTARQRLYIANLQALQSCLQTNEMRMARRVYAENLTITGTPPPLEMECLGARLDDALVVLDFDGAEVKAVAYGPKGNVLGASVVDWLDMSHQTGELQPGSRQWLDALSRSPHATATMRDRQHFFSVGPQHRHTPLVDCDERWAEAWRSRMSGPGRRAAGGALPLAISPDERHEAVVAGDGGVRIVDQVTGAAVAILNGQPGRLTKATFCADGSRLVTLGSDGKLQLWDAGSGSLVAVCGGAGRLTFSFDCSPDGSRLAAIERIERGDHEIHLHDTRDGRRLSTLTISKNAAIAALLVAFSPSGDRLITTANEHDLHVWDTSTGTLLADLSGHAAVVTAVAFSADGRHIASGGTNGTIGVWNAHTLAMERILTGHDGAVASLAFSPDGETLASGSNDGTVRIWSLLADEPLGVLPGVRGLTAAVFSADGRQVAVAPKESGDVELWDAATVERRHVLVGAGGVVSQTAFSPDGTLVAAAFKRTDGAPSEARVWRADSGDVVATLAGHGRGAQSVAFSPDGSRLLTTSGDAVVYLWDPGTGERLMDVSAGEWRGPFRHTAAVFGLDGSRVAYKMPTLLDSATGLPTADLRPRGQVSCLAASPDGRILAAGTAIGTTVLSEFATGARRADLVGSSGAVLAIAFTPDGRRVVTGTLDGDVCVWDASTGQSLHVLHGHEGQVEAVLVTPDGRRLVSAATDGTIRVWDADSGQALSGFDGDRDFPKAISLSPDGTRLLAAEPSGTVRIWGLSNAAVITARQAAAARDGAAPREPGETPPDRPDPADSAPGA